MKGHDKTEDVSVKIIAVVRIFSVKGFESYVSKNFYR
jgi:hypothetical protein